MSERKIVAFVISFENEGHDDQGYYPTEVELKKYFEVVERPRDDIVVEGRPLYIDIDALQFGFGVRSGWRRR